jgi:general secretion pathway protein D
MNRLSATALLIGLGAVGCSTTWRDLTVDNQLRTLGTEQALKVMSQQLADRPNDMVLRARYLQALSEYTSQRLAQAQVAYDAGDSNRARQLLEQLLQVVPDNDDALSLLRWLDTQDEATAKLHQAEGLAIQQPRQAVRLLDQVLLVQPDNRRAEQLRHALAMDDQDDLTPQLSAKMDEKISVQFQGQPLMSVFDLVSRITGLNFAFDSEVEPSKPVTVYANNVPVRQVLDMVLRSSQLEGQPMSGSSMMIYPARPDKTAEYRTLEMRTIYLNYASAPQVMGMLKQMVKSQDIFVDERTNAVIIRDRRQAIEATERLIAAIDVPQAEVMLDVQVLEVSGSDLMNLGLSYPGVISASPFSEYEPGRPAGSLTLAELHRINSGNVLVNLGNPTLRLNMLQTAGKVRALANPRIRVRNRDEASVHIGDRVPVVTTTLSESFSTESVTYEDVGLSLTVEPTIGNDDEVQVKLSLEASNIAETIETPTGLMAYRLTTRKAETYMSVTNNQTQALGGLLQHNGSSTTSGLPGLSRVPLLGRLFGNINNDKRETELILLITPHIVRRPPKLPAHFARFASGTEKDVMAGRSPDAELPADAVIGELSVGPPPPLLKPSPSQTSPIEDGPGSESVPLPRQDTPPETPPNPPGPTTDEPPE